MLAGRAQAIIHSLESLSLFGKFGVPPPTEYDQFPSAISALEAKKAWYNTAPAPEKPAKSETAAGAAGSADAAA